MLIKRPKILGFLFLITIVANNYGMRMVTISSNNKARALGALFDIGLRLLEPTIVVSEFEGDLEKAHSNSLGRALVMFGSVGLCNVCKWLDKKHGAPSRSARVNVWCERLISFLEGAMASDSLIALVESANYLSLIQQVKSDLAASASAYDEYYE